MDGWRAGDNGARRRAGLRRRRGGGEGPRPGEHARTGGSAWRLARHQQWSERDLPGGARAAGWRPRAGRAGGARMSEPITVMLVDDHAVVRQGIRALLDAEG